MRDGMFVRMGSSWQEREAASMGRRPDREPAACSGGEDGKTPESHGFRGGGGGWGIRTPEGLHPTRFPSVRHRPLGESSRRSTRRQPRATRKEYIGPPIPGASPGRWDLSRRAGLAASAQRGRTAGLGDAPAGTVLEPYGASSTSGGGGEGGSQPGAGSGSLSFGPSCGVIQRIPQDRKVARVSRLWRVREGSSRARAVKRAACCGGRRGSGLGTVGLRQTAPGEDFCRVGGVAGDEGAGNGHGSSVSPADDALALPSCQMAPDSPGASHGVGPAD